MRRNTRADNVVYPFSKLMNSRRLKSEEVQLQYVTEHEKRQEWVSEEKVGEERERKGKLIINR